MPRKTKKTDPSKAPLGKGIARMGAGELKKIKRANATRLGGIQGVIKKYLRD